MLRCSFPYLSMGSLFLSATRMSSRSSAAVIPYDSARLIRGDIQNFAVASPRRTWICSGSSGSPSFLRIPFLLTEEFDRISCPQGIDTMSKIDVVGDKNSLP